MSHSTGALSFDPGGDPQKLEALMRMLEDFFLAPRALFINLDTPGVHDCVTVARIDRKGDGSDMEVSVVLSNGHVLLRLDTGKRSCATQWHVLYYLQGMDHFHASGQEQAGRGNRGSEYQIDIYRIFCPHCEKPTDSFAMAGQY